MAFRSPRFLLLLGLVCIVVVWLLRGPQRRAGTVEELQGPIARLAQGTDSSKAFPANLPPQPSAQKPPQEQLPIPPCWDGLLELDEHATIDSLREAMLAGLQDPLLIEYLEARLADVIGSDAQAALSVLAAAKDAGPPLSTHLLAGLQKSAAVQKPHVADKLLALGADGKQPQELRKAALEALETQHSLSQPMLSRLHSIAMDEHSDEAAWLAARTIGKVMTDEVQRGGSAAPYLKELLDIGQHSAEAAVRTLALEMPSYANVPVDKSALNALAQVLSRDPDRSVREMAAFRMGLSRDPNQALALLAAAFEEERDLCVRWAMFRFAVRAAGPKSLPVLDKMSTTDPRLRPDYEDFVAIYARGVVDFARVWQEKRERIQCLDEEG